MKQNISMLLMCCLLLASCLPSSPPEPIVIERSCSIEPLPAKQSLPPVHYTQIVTEVVGGDIQEYLCLDPTNQEADKERELRLKQDARTCQEAYSRAIERCTKGQEAK